MGDMPASISRICGLTFHTVFICLGKIEGGNHETMMTKTPASTPFYWTRSLLHPVLILSFIHSTRSCRVLESGSVVDATATYAAIVVDFIYTLLPATERSFSGHPSSVASLQWNRILIEIKWDSVIYQTNWTSGAGYLPMPYHLEWLRNDDGEKVRKESRDWQRTRPDGNSMASGKWSEFSMIVSGSVWTFVAVVQSSSVLIVVVEMWWLTRFSLNRSSIPSHATAAVLFALQQSIVLQTILRGNLFIACAPPQRLVCSYNTKERNENRNKYPSPHN